MKHDLRRLLYYIRSVSFVVIRRGTCFQELHDKIEKRKQACICALHATRYLRRMQSMHAGEQRQEGSVERFRYQAGRLRTTYRTPAPATTTLLAGCAGFMKQGFPLPEEQRSEVTAHFFDVGSDVIHLRNDHLARMSSKIL